jgi:transposase InsO family protein
MNELYAVLGISKQAYWKRVKKFTEENELNRILIQSILEIRSHHPKMGAKKIYSILNPEGMGRDAFIDLYVKSGFQVVSERNNRKTTHSLPFLKYENLASGMTLNNINQVWSSDITYFQISEKEFLYIVLIIDVYSRRILGFNASTDLRAQSNVKALNMALKERNIERYEDLIHHSDRGVQYTSKAYTELLEKYNIKISMCESVYENTHIERVNGIIKNEYLCHFRIKNLSQCQRTLKKVVKVYNCRRPHEKLDLKTPVDFENHLPEIPFSSRPLVNIYSDQNKNLNSNIKQGTLFF